MKKIILIFLLSSLIFPTILFAEAKNALLIANGNYESFSSLATPGREANDLRKSLESLDFDVTVIENGSREEMSDSLYDFQKKLEREGGIAFFHYGGHAVQVNGKNYLIPVDADIPDERRIATRAIDVDEVMTSMVGDTNIVILDSCRNNPLPAGSGRSATRGLSLVVEKPKNSIIVFSAEPGKVAQDGVFTPILAKKLLEQKSFSDILIDVRKEVQNKTNSEQSPEEWGRLTENIYLAGYVEPQNEVVKYVEKEVLVEKEVVVEKKVTETVYLNSTEENLFINAIDWSVNKSKGTMTIINAPIEFEGREYEGLCIRGNTGKQNADYSDWWAASQWNVEWDRDLKSFLCQGDTIKFRVLGDGKPWVFRVMLRGNTSYSYEFSTKNKKITEVSIPYERLKFDEWTNRRSFNSNEITGVEFTGGTAGTSSDRDITIFDVRVY